MANLLGGILAGLRLRASGTGSDADPYVPVVGVMSAFGASDVLGRLKTARQQNVYDADFEYGPQPLRWESLALGSATITHLPGDGGVRMRVTTAAGDATIRQSRPYHRYQPGKTMFMATAVNFGAALSGQVQRIGFLDDGNGCFFEQGNPTVANPFGMAVVVRSDAGGLPVDTRIDLTNWTGDTSPRPTIDWSRIQMLFIEYAWYGAGMVRWGVFIDGVPQVLHQIGFGNRAGQARPWARTGNLPVRYEQRNLTAQASSNDMTHYGVSVCIEGGVDDQRGFTYGYGMALQTPRRTVAAATTRFPVLSIRPRAMGTIEFNQASSGGAATAGTTTTLTAAGAAWTVNQWTGRMLFIAAYSSGTASAGASTTLTDAGKAWGVNQWAGLQVRTTGGTGAGQVRSIASNTATALTVSVAWTTNPDATTTYVVEGVNGAGATARIISNTATVLTFQDVITSNPALTVAPGQGALYQIGLINRGQLLPRRLLISSSALAQCEIIVSTPGSPIIITGASWAALNTLGSANSLAERDVSGTSLSGGEVVMKFTLPAGGSGLQDLDLSQLFPLFTTIRGNLPDVLTVAISTQAGTPADVGADIICQEAMS